MLHDTDDVLGEAKIIFKSGTQYCPIDNQCFFLLKHKNKNACPREYHRFLHKRLRNVSLNVGTGLYYPCP